MLVGSGNSGGLIPEILDYVRPANPPLLAFGGVIDMDHRDFFGQALHGAQPDLGQTGHLGVGMTCPIVSRTSTSCRFSIPSILLPPPSSLRPTGLTTRGTGRFSIAYG